MRIHTQRDDATLPAVLVVLLVVLASVTVSGSLQRLGADGASLVGESEADENALARARLEEERRSLRESVERLVRTLQQPEVKRRLGIEGQDAERRSR